MKASDFTNLVKSDFLEYGYELPENYIHQGDARKITVHDILKNKDKQMSYKDLLTTMKRGKRKKYEPPQESDFPLENSYPYSDVQQSTLLEQIHRTTSDNLKAQRNFRLDIDPNEDPIAQLKMFMRAVKEEGPRLSRSVVQTTITTSDNHTYYKVLNENTINELDLVFSGGNDIHGSDSADLSQDMNSITSININIVPRVYTYSRIRGGVFPYLSTFPDDLSKYGIFQSLSDERIKLPCLYLAFKNSSLNLSEDQLKLLLSTIQTRYVKREDLKLVSDLLNINIKLDVLTDDNKVLHSEFNANSKESISLWLMDHHFFLNEITSITEYYIANQGLINSLDKFKSHPRKSLLKRFDQDHNRYEFAKKGLSIAKLIQKLLETNYLQRIPEEELSKLSWSFQRSDDFTFNISKPVIIKDRANFKNKSNNHPTQYLLGYKPEEDEDINKRLDELQQVINSLPLRNNINVRNYFKFSELMQKVMYEYGCYDDVYKISGQLAQDIRSQCIFPKIHTYNYKPFYSNQKLYYLDLNGAYMAAVKHIPTGIPQLDISQQTTYNPKIKELIEYLYKKRKQSNPKLSTTLKFMMTSCWGYAIQRPKRTKSQKLTKPLNLSEPYLLGYDSTHYTTMNSIVSSFIIPHFAREVLIEFKRIMDDIKSIVNVLYENIDAILITEEDYNKLLSLNKIGPRLGQFKIEHIFTEIAILSQRKYVATLSTGEYYYHCVKPDTNYTTFINLVKNTI